MKLEIDDDLLLPIITIILTLCITTSTFFITKTSHEKVIEGLVIENQGQFQEISMANQEINTLTKELQSYRVTIQDIEHAGASHTQAIDALKASQLYNLDPKL